MATDEIRFGDNDRLAALVAHLVHADLLVLLSDVDGLYDAHPGAAGSRLVDRGRSGRRPRRRATWRRSAGAGVGTGGMRTKLEAARIATGAGIPVVLTSAEQARRRPGRRAGRHVVPRRPAKRRPDAAAVAGPRDRAQGGRCCSTTARCGRSPSAGPRCSPAGLTGGRPAPSPPATRSTWPDPTAWPSPADWSTSTPRRSRAGRQDLPPARRELGAAYEREVVHRDALVVM